MPTSYRSRSWRDRKEAYIVHLAEAEPSVIRVSLVDKLHKARAILRDYRAHSEELSGRFDPSSDQLWHYRALADPMRRLPRAGCGPHAASS